MIIIWPASSLWRLPSMSAPLDSHHGSEIRRSFNRVLPVITRFVRGSSRWHSDNWDSPSMIGIGFHFISFHFGFLWKEERLVRWFLPEVWSLWWEISSRSSLLTLHSSLFTLTFSRAFSTLHASLFTLHSSLLILTLILTLIYSEETSTIPILQPITKCNSFQNNPGTFRERVTLKFQIDWLIKAWEICSEENIWRLRSSSILRRMVEREVMPDLVIGWGVTTFCPLDSPALMRNFGCNLKMGW
jgi:hypothetical protein